MEKSHKKLKITYKELLGNWIVWVADLYATDAISKGDLERIVSNLINLYSEDDKI